MFLSYFSSCFFPSFLSSFPLSFSSFPSVFLLCTSSSPSHPLLCMYSWTGLQASLQVTALNIPTFLSHRYFGFIQDWLCSSPSMLTFHLSSLPRVAFIPLVHHPCFFLISLIMSPLHLLTGWILTSGDHRSSSMIWDCPHSLNAGKSPCLEKTCMPISFS